MVAHRRLRTVLFDRLAVRLRPGDEGFRLGEPTGRAEIAGWFAFPDAQPIDAVALLFVADAFPPPVLQHRPAGRPGCRRSS